MGCVIMHIHWRFIRDFILWCGYSIRFARTANLAEITPQHRDRLIIIVTLDSAELFPHLPVTWPSTQRQTLESYLNIMDLEEPWLSQCALNDDLLKIYMDPQLLPKSLDQRGRNLKRCRRDVEHGIFGCVMSNYSYGHLLPDATLQHAGLFGTLLALPNGLRLIVFLLLRFSSCWLPSDHRTCIRLLGNSIATPHALLNALAFFDSSHEQRDDLQEPCVGKKVGWFFI